ncbi:ABC transporter substrate-binding protein [Dongia deserti]|uniref:ABC transporter substrate-binding protein n=1 Tax=Dongia deserti TaxID=2268030 RepID=UPI000E653694|nr:ABC transporter substrate-binding protein [Dongia deserti]
MKPFLRSALQGSLAAVAILASSVAAQAKTPADTLVMAYVIDDFISLDPAEIYEFAASEYMANTYDRLVVIDPDNTSQLKLQAAESWSVSDDGKTFTFKIRPGIKFESGNEMTAEDAEFSMERFVLLNKNPAFIMNQFGLTAENVKDKVRVKDPMTLEVELDAPYAPSFFMNCLSYTSVVVDKKTVMEHEENGDLGHGWMRTNYAGSGPFFFRSWKPNDSLVLEANEGYWDGAPKIKRVLIKNVTESATQQLLLQKGDIDVARNLTGDQVTAVSKDPNVKIQSKPKAALWYMGLNTKNPHIAKVEVRQAMKYLVDYDGLGESMFAGTGIKHQSFLPDGQLGAYNENPYSLNVTKAKELLAKAGYPDGFNITMETTNKTEARELSASLQNTMAQAGINLIIKLADNKTTLTKYRASEHDIYLGEWGSDYQDPHSNAEGYLMAPLAKRNQWVDEARSQKVLAARDEKDSAKRAQMYVDLQKMALEESPYVIMFQRVETAALRKNVDGLIIGPTFDLNLYRDVVKH